LPSFAYATTKTKQHPSSTKGLLFGTRCYPDSPDCADVLYESTGMYGKSDVRITRLDTGAVEARAAMDAKWFGEGLARRGDLLYQVTWQGPQGFVYSAADLKLVGEFKTPLKDGWGIALDDTGNAYSDSTGKGGGGKSGGGGGGGGLLVVSDGSDTLTWIDPDDGYRRVRSVKVQSNDRPVVWLNELEFVQGELWANVWQTDCVARICPATGNVTGWLLLHGVRDALLARNLPQRGAAMDVLNGAARAFLRLMGWLACAPRSKLEALMFKPFNNPPPKSKTNSKTKSKTKLKASRGTPTAGASLSPASTGRACLRWSPCRPTRTPRTTSGASRRALSTESQGRESMRARG
jgi:glutamine cyclotransferase